jgi:hypothetical protein
MHRALPTITALRMRFPRVGAEMQRIDCLDNRGERQYGCAFATGP